VCRPKHVEQLRNIGIINSTKQLHLVGSLYEIYITMHGSMNIKWTSVNVLPTVCFRIHFNNILSSKSCCSRRSIFCRFSYKVLYIFLSSFMLAACLSHIYPTVAMTHTAIHTLIYLRVLQRESSSLLSKNLKIKVYRTLIFPFVRHGCETWSLTLR
jgi:hypothetical protein